MAHITRTPYREPAVSPSEARASMHKAAEEWAMENILRSAGYLPHKARTYAKHLSAEGMGPEELRHRLKTAPGEVGSLEYTHRMTRR